MLSSVEIINHEYVLSSIYSMNHECDVCSRYDKPQGDLIYSADRISHDVLSSVDNNHINHECAISKKKKKKKKKEM